MGLQPATAFFTEGEATAYPIHIPDEFELSEEQNARLDAYLARRFQGDFTMAGIRFWPDMQGLDESFLKKAAGFRQIVPIFTNVIFDTSQPHANTVFEDMFDWLALSLEVIRKHRYTLFIIRAHPDELRVRKASRETVEGWVASRAADKEPNVVFVGPRETLSSYELIQRTAVNDGKFRREHHTCGEAAQPRAVTSAERYATCQGPCNKTHQGEGRSDAGLCNKRHVGGGEFYGDLLAAPQHREQHHKTGCRRIERFSISRTGNLLHLGEQPETIRYSRIKRYVYRKGTPDPGL